MLLYDLVFSWLSLNQTKKSPNTNPFSNALSQCKVANCSKVNIRLVSPPPEWQQPHEQKQNQNKQKILLLGREPKDSLQNGCSTSFGHLEYKSEKNTKNLEKSKKKKRVMLFMKGMGDDGKGELVDRFSTYEVTTTTIMITFSIILIHFDHFYQILLTFSQVYLLLFNFH